MNSVTEFYLEKIEHFEKLCAQASYDGDYAKWEQAHRELENYKTMYKGATK